MEVKQTEKTIFVDNSNLGSGGVQWKKLHGGIVKKINPEIDKGIVVILGQMTYYEDRVLGYDTNILQSIKGYDSQNILYVNFSGDSKSLESIGQEIQSFAEY